MKLAEDSLSILIAGSSKDSPTGNHKIFLVKTDLNGNRIWQRDCVYTDSICGIRSTIDEEARDICGVAFIEDKRSFKFIPGKFQNESLSRNGIHEKSRYPPLGHKELPPVADHNAPVRSRRLGPQAQKPQGCNGKNDIAHVQGGLHNDRR